jgi:transposase
MMGPVKRLQPKLFRTFNIEERIPADHPLREILRLIDFGFVRREVADCYGSVGNPSVDPIVLMKLMFLLYYENVRSERALMAQMPLRLDWLWFCGYDLDDEVPDHSAISRARGLWGVEVFERLFGRVLRQCIEAGLVDGEIVHVDASLIAADASLDRLQPALRKVGHDLYEALDEAATESTEDTPPEQDEPPSPGLTTSATDRDARLTRSAKGGPLVGYKDHRAVDDRCGIVTVTVTTDASMPEAQMMEEVLDRHGWNVGCRVVTPVADKGYGTGENYRMMHERGMKPCVPHPSQNQAGKKFHAEEFAYDAEGDVMICPAGQELKYFNREAKRKRTRYKASKGTCQGCPLKSKCTGSKGERIVSRHDDQEHIDWADGCLSKAERKRLMGRRKSKAEGSFADGANNHGYKRARWRGLERMTIQNVMIATVQNVRKLAKWVRRRGAAASKAIFSGLRRLRAGILSTLEWIPRHLTFFAPHVIPSWRVLPSHQTQVLRHLSSEGCATRPDTLGTRSYRRDPSAEGAP